MHSNNPISRRENIVVQDADGEVLIYDLDSNKAFCLNETSSIVWELCDGKNSVSEISIQLGKKLKVQPNEDLVWLALEQLKKQKLLKHEENVAINFAGLSRREVIKRVGVGTMAALPVIVALSAPSAAHAQSNAACSATQLGAMCTCTDAAVMNGICTEPNTCGSGAAVGCVCRDANSSMSNFMGTCETIV